MTLDPNYAGDGIYREHILDHYKNPRNAGTLEHPSFSHRELNASCGDEITITVEEKDDILTAFRFVGKGCAISQASTSMLSEAVVGKSFQSIMQLQREQVMDLLGIEVGAQRTKCLMLGLVALKNGIAVYQAQREYG